MTYDDGCVSSIAMKDSLTLNEDGSTNKVTGFCRKRLLSSPICFHPGGSRHDPVPEVMAVKCHDGGAAISHKSLQGVLHDLISDRIIPSPLSESTQPPYQ